MSDDDYNYKNPIKIQQSPKDAKKSKKDERKYRKQVLKVDKIKTTFEQPIIDINDEQNKKMDEFIKYCKTINKCITCSNRGEERCYIPLQNFKANDDDEIIMKCMGCLSYMVDGARQSKDYVKWINESIMKEYNMTFQEYGFPEMMRHKYMGMCYDCVPAHEKVMIEFFDFREEA